MNDENLICEDCGDVGKETICPYQLELYDNEVEVVLCDSCERERYYDT